MDKLKVLDVTSTRCSACLKPKLWMLLVEAAVSGALCSSVCVRGESRHGGVTWKSLYLNTLILKPSESRLPARYLCSYGLITVRASKGWFLVSLLPSSLVLAQLTSCITQSFYNLMAVWQTEIAAVFSHQMSLPQNEREKNEQPWCFYVVFFLPCIHDNAQLYSFL